MHKDDIYDYTIDYKNIICLISIINVTYFDNCAPF